MHCHSERDWKTHGAPALPGLAGAGWDVPWADNHMPGPVFAPNLTPDPDTGIGAIPDDAVARAIREGVSQDGRALFMMPWENYRRLSDEDVASVVVYLRTLPAVKKARGTTAIRAPVRWFLKAGPAPLTLPVAPAPASDPVARGRQLSDIGQCQSCHTPVDTRHQPLPGMAFAGGGGSPRSCPGRTLASSPTRISRRCGRISRPSPPSPTTSNGPRSISRTTRPSTTA